MLEIKQLIKKYRTGDLAINGVDLKVEKGQVMALIGGKEMEEIADSGYRGRR